MACYIYKGNTYTKEELLAIKNQIIAENEAVFNQMGSEALNDVNILIDKLKETGLAEEVIVGNTQTLLDVLDEVGASEGLKQQVQQGPERQIILNGQGVTVRTLPEDVSVINGFYSPIEKRLAETKIDKQSANKWLSVIGKGDEATWTGVKAWLEDKNPQEQVTKSEIQQWMKDNRIEVVEVVKGDESAMSEKEKANKREIERLNQEIEISAQAIKSKGYDLETDMGGEGDILIDEDGEAVDYDELPDDIRELYDNHGELFLKRQELQENEYDRKGDNTKFSKWQLEGEKENYKEVLVTLPSREGKNPLHSKRDELSKKQREAFNSGNYELANEIDNEISEITKQLISENSINTTGEKAKFKSSHFEEPNILVHLRMNTRTDANGNKVLFLEEVQSDWGQTGKKQGFQNRIDYTELAKEASKKEGIEITKGEIEQMVVSAKNNWTSGTKDQVYLRELFGKERADEIITNHKPEGTPSAPFVTDTNDWTKLGLKVALKEAVKQGADMIAWTTGEQQNDRYDLRKQVDEIKVLPQYGGSKMTYAVQGFKDGKMSTTMAANSVAKLEGIIGKELAKKVADKGEFEGELSFKGDDLKVGGKGMKGFYGSPTEGSLGIVGNVAKSLFKQVPKTTVLIQDIVSLTPIKQHSIDITPELKAEVEQGQPLFQKEPVKLIPTGFVKGKKVYINSDVATIETPIHEFAHLYNAWLKENKAELYNRGLELVRAELEKKNSPIQSVIDYVKSTQPNLQGEALQEEILTQLTGKKGLELLQSKKKGGIINWIKEALAEIANMLGLSNYSVEQAMNMTIDEFAKAIAVDLLKGENFTGKDGKANFEKWKGNNKLVEGSEIQDVKTGEPIVAKGYHGTTNEFYEFDASVKGNIEGHLGKVNYFTSDYQDASTNYLSEGADITGRVENLKDRILSNLETEVDDSLEEDEREDRIRSVISENYPEFDTSSLDFNMSFDEVADRVSSSMLIGEEEQVLEVFVKLNNPVILGKGSTWFETLNVSDSDLEQAAQEIADENDITLEEAKDDYNFDIEQRAIENTGYENLHVEALRDALQSNGYDGALASDILGDNYYETDVDLNKLEQDLRKSELYDNAEGEMASGQVIADFFKNLGFDGVILTDVSQRFKNMGLGSGTSHIHVFDEFNNQIKLADGSNVTFGETPDIRFQKQAGITKAEAIKRNNGNPLNLAPNGKSSILYQSYKDLGYFDSEAERLTAQTFSDEFKAWFGDWQNDAENASKVMDENGQPKLMYHETAADWFIYDKTKIEAGKLDSVTPTGIFLKSSNKNIGLGNRQMNLFSSIKNPIYAKDRKELENFFSLNIKGYSEIKEKSSQVEKEYDKILEKEGPRLKEAFKKEIEDFKGELTSEDRIKLVEKVYKNSDTELNDLEVEFENLAIEAKALIDSFMKDSNYDGIFLTSDVGSKGRETDATIAMNPEQIKSATGNIGTFSPTNADIRFQTIPTEETTTIPDCV